MNTSLKTIVLSVALAAASQLAVHAQDTESEKTRAQVIAELEGARMGGELGSYSAEDSGSFRLSQQTASAGRSRADVISEMYAARASGETAAITGEDSGAAWLANHGQPAQLARVAVVTDVLQARATGELGAMVGEDSGSFWLAAHAFDGYGSTYAGRGMKRAPAPQDGLTLAGSSR